MANTNIEKEGRLKEKGKSCDTKQNQDKSFLVSGKTVKKAKQTN